MNDDNEKITRLSDYDDFFYTDDDDDFDNGTDDDDGLPVIDW